MSTDGLNCKINVTIQVYRQSIIQFKIHTDICGCLINCCCCTNETTTAMCQTAANIGLHYTLNLRYDVLCINEKGDCIPLQTGPVIPNKSGDLDTSGSESPYIKSILRKIIDVNRKRKNKYNIKKSPVHLRPRHQTMTSRDTL